MCNASSPSRISIKDDIMRKVSPLSHKDINIVLSSHFMLILERLNIHIFYLDKKSIIVY